uniref:Putative lipocalin-3 1 n=1 Tax=Rhipicephalus microplus TaxID=6941 RepID=A0A6M2D0T6_RHIMP
MHRFIPSAISLLVLCNVLQWSNCVLDLKKFLSTNSTVWTYYSTQNRQLLCLNDAMVNIMEKSVVLNRSYYEGPERRYTTVEWVFLETERTKNTGFYACMLHNELDHLHFIVQCIRYHNESSQCAVMEYQVRSLKGDMPQSSLLYPSSTAAKKDGNMAVFSWHELQTKKPVEPMTSENDCLRAFSNLSRVALTWQDYFTACQMRLHLPRRKTYNFIAGSHLHATSIKKGR